VFNASAVSQPVSALKTRRSGGAVLVSGEMIEKCPIAGCWFMLKDHTGVLRVDTKAAGFVVADLPLHTEITACGAMAGSGEPELHATGIRF
ncbi:MAG TPA: hypothetical protein VGS41_09070, partial [Chthonomonadales bacterium]|nr:hypothetical protein [Chthonomonadales bacterium]